MRWRALPGQDQNWRFPRTAAEAVVRVAGLNKKPRWERVSNKYKEPTQ